MKISFMIFLALCQNKPLAQNRFWCQCLSLLIWTAIWPFNNAGDRKIPLHASGCSIWLGFPITFFPRLFIEQQLRLMYSCLHLVPGSAGFWATPNKSWMTGTFNVHENSFWNPLEPSVMYVDMYISWKQMDLFYFFHHCEMEFWGWSQTEHTFQSIYGNMFSVFLSLFLSLNGKLIK